MNALILNNLPNIIGFIALSLFVLACLREFTAWYFKVNKRIELQELLLIEQIKTNAYLDVEHNTKTPINGGIGQPGACGVNTPMTAER